MSSNIVFDISEKSDGSMYLASDRAMWNPENIKNRQRFFEKLGLARKKIIALSLAHGTQVTVVDNQSDDFLLEMDGLVTRDPGVVLTLTAADRIPVYFVDLEKRVIGLGHAGWRGVVKGIVPRTLETMRAEGAETVKVTLGPGICAEHFEIQKDILSQFEPWSEAITHKKGKIFVDLKTIIRKQLSEAGIIKTNITDIARWCGDILKACFRE